MNSDSAEAVRRHMQNLASNAELAADLVAGPAARYAELVREILSGSREHFDLLYRVSATEEPKLMLGGELALTVWHRRDAQPVPPFFLIGTLPLGGQGQAVVLLRQLVPERPVAALEAVEHLRHEVARRQDQIHVRRTASKSYRACWPPEYPM